MVSPTLHFKIGKMTLEKDIDKRATSFKGRGNRLDNSERLKAVGYESTGPSIELEKIK